MEENKVVLSRAEYDAIMESAVKTKIIASHVAKLKYDSDIAEFVRAVLGIEVKKDA